MVDYRLYVFARVFPKIECFEGARYEILNILQVTRMSLDWIAWKYCWEKSFLIWRVGRRISL